jgi:DNA processing protein
VPRNRLIAALSAAVVVVVVEAAGDSGSLSTARAAGSRGGGRVLAVPGAPWDSGADGCNQLIRDGATLVRGLADILEELGTSTGPAGATPPPRSGGIGQAARAVLAALVDGQFLGPHRLATAAGLTPTDLDTAILDLELAGLIRHTTAGVQAIALPPGLIDPTGPPTSPSEPRPRDGIGEGA